MYFPGFRYIPPNKYEAEEGLQMKLDAFSGLCVTWSILYLHYRILNPDIQPAKLIRYLPSTPYGSMSLILAFIVIAETGAGR